MKEKSEVTCEKKRQKLLSNFDIHSYKALQSYTDISKFESVIDLEWDIQLARNPENYAFVQKSKYRWQNSFLIIIVF